MKRCKRILALCLALCPALFPSQAEERSLTVATWGGPYQNAQQEALFAPFEAATGIRIETQHYTGGLGILQQDPLPDIVDMTMDDALLACEQGLLQQRDWREVAAPSPDGLAPEQDFIDGAFTPCGVAHLTYSTLIAYDERAFNGEKPRRIADFFDLARFPGKRALRRQPAEILEWALMTEGVPINQVYDLLSTDRGMRLALRRLDSIRDHIVWWQDPGEPEALLKSGEVVMSSGFNGRFFDARTRGEPVSMIWDGQIVDWDVWAVPVKPGLSHTEIDRFLRFVTRSENMAALAEQIPYGPSRSSALHRIGLHPQYNFSMRNHLPTAPHHLRRALIRDSEWYARTAELRNNRFRAWLETAETR